MRLVWGSPKVGIAKALLLLEMAGLAGAYWMYRKLDSNEALDGWVQRDPHSGRQSRTDSLRRSWHPSCTNNRLKGINKHEHSSHSVSGVSINGGSWCLDNSPQGVNSSCSSSEGVNSSSSSSLERIYVSFVKAASDGRGFETTFDTKCIINCQPWSQFTTSLMNWQGTQGFEKQTCCVGRSGIPEKHAMAKTI